MSKSIKKAVQYIIFLSIGIFLFYTVYKEFDFNEIKNELHSVRYSWIILAFILGILSHISRSIRWKMLIRPLGYTPKTSNIILSVLILYFVNIIIPRGGELARCSALGKYEKIPISKLLGTVVTERLVDTIVLFLMVFGVLIMQIGKMDEFLSLHPDIENRINSFNLSYTWVFVLICFVVIFILFYVYRSSLLKGKIGTKIKGYLSNFKDGIKSIMKLENKGWFVFHSLFIYFLYYLMFHVVFFSYEPTKDINIVAGLSAFVAGGLAMLAPVQAGIGAWHFMVYETLFLYGVDKYDGKIFALISHTSTNLLILVAGLIAFALLPLLNSNTFKSKE